jgi:hypothetical protein
LDLHEQEPYSPPSHSEDVPGPSKQGNHEPAKSNPKSKPTPVPHTYRSDGLLEVNPNGTHPLFELIAKAEEAWDQKFKMASKTLEDAVDEYYRRYKRFPPKGFDKW